MTTRTVYGKAKDFKSNALENCTVMPCTTIQTMRTGHCTVQ